MNLPAALTVVKIAHFEKLYPASNAVAATAI
jgi:hypothetical protein